jgi:hypothetical protein
MANQYSDSYEKVSLEQKKADLRAWLNTEPTPEDNKQLAKLLLDGKFRAWDCPRCGARVYEGQPDDWQDFQGALQVDYTSYPGVIGKYSEEDLLSLCDCCRCQHSAADDEANENP